MVAASDTARFVVEHTRIESFERQIADGKRLQELMEPLEAVLPQSLSPGTYDIVVEPSAARTFSARHLEPLRTAIKTWVIEAARGLKLGPDGDFAETDVVDERPWEITERPRDVPFEVTLRRRPTDDGVLVFAMGFMPADIEEQRAARVRTALARKCPKLGAAKLQHDALSVLLLESDDIALANRHVISAAVVQELKARTDQPDYVFLIETDRGLAWELWIVKEGEREYPAIDKPGPFHVDHRPTR